jgi:amino acid transporter
MTVVLMIPQILYSYGIRLTAKLNDISVYWHIGGVAIIAGLLTSFSKYHNSLEFTVSDVPVVNPLDAASGTLADGRKGPALFLGPLVLHSPIFARIPGLEALYAASSYLLAFPLAFLQAQWTYTGHDASAHVPEETVLARLNNAWDVFLSVAVSAVFGCVVLMVFTYAIPNGDVAATTLDPYPVLYIANSGLSAFLANGVGMIVFGGMWLCGLATITSMSRMFFAFARDQGMPSSSVFSDILPKYRTPAKPIFWTSVLAMLLTISSAAYFVVTSILTITLYVACGIRNWLNLRNRLRKKGEHTTPEKAPWSLKQWGPFINLVAVIWIVFITILFCLPPNELVMWTVIAFGLILLVYWFDYARKHFDGPKSASEEELRKIEAMSLRPPGAPATRRLSGQGPGKRSGPWLVARIPRFGGTQWG